MLKNTTLTGWALGLLVALSGSGSMQAQFAGPALTASDSANLPQKPTTDAAILMPGARDPAINPGDLIVVRVFGTPDFAPPVRVSVDGSVQLPLIGPVQVAGLTVNKAEDLIATRLSSAGMYVNPQVSVQVTEAATQFATVAGEMHANVPISGDRRLLDVLAAAGPLPATASHVVTILRPGLQTPIVVDLGTDPAKSAQADIRILPGDKILIARVGVVYMLGAFKVQGAIPLQQNSPLTLLQATAISQGAGFEGKYKDLRIVRTVGLTRTVVKLDISKVLDGKAPDPILQADDIVFLPSDSLKAAIKSGGINVVTGIASLLVIALAQSGI
jgi:polysaccharide export outer membrane protein